MEQTLVNIQLLEQAEMDLAANVLKRTMEENKNRSLLYNTKELLRYIHSLSAVDHKAIFNPDGNWINATDGVTVLSQLVCNSNILLDLQPNLKSNQQFVMIYGFSVQQLLILTRQKKIRLNLIGYESNKNIGFKEYLVFDGNEEEKAAYTDLFSLENGMRINSIRRKLFFDLSLIQKKCTYEQFLQEGKEIFTGLLKVPSGELGKVDLTAIFRVSSIAALIETLSHQYAYIKLMSVLDLATPEAQKITELISHAIPTPEGLIHYSEIMRGLKVIIASPLLGPMGGTYSMSSSALASIRSLQIATGRTFVPEDDVYSTLVKDLAQHHLSEKYKNRILSSILKRKEIANAPMLNAPLFLTDKEFESYLGFIEDIVPKKEELNSQMEKLSFNSYLNEDRVDIIEQYMLTQSSLLKNYELFSKFIHSSFEGNTPVLIGVLLGYIMSNNVVVSLTSGIVGAFVSNTVLSEKAIDKALRHFFSNKHQLLLDIESIKKLID